MSLAALLITLFTGHSPNMAGFMGLTFCIIVASHKPNVGDDLLGTTAARVVRHAAGSVFAVRLDEVMDL